MPIVQDQLIAQRTGITFAEINNETVTRVLHNGSDFAAYKLLDHATNPIVTYYGTDGSRKSSRTLDSDYVLDVNYYGGRYFQLRHQLLSGSGVLTLDEILSNGTLSGTIVNRLDILPPSLITASSSTILTNPIGTFALAVDDNNGAFVKVQSDIYRVNLAGTYSPSVYYDEFSSDVNVASGIVTTTGTSSFQFSHLGSSRFLQYVDYDENTQEVILKTATITGAGAPISSNREVFLTIPDWANNTQISGTANSGISYNVCLHGTDNGTVFYFRKNGIGEVNTTKTSGTNGVTNSGTLFVAAGEDFITDNIQVGDIIKLNGGTPTPALSNFRATIVEVSNATNLLLNTSISTRTGLTYSICSNAEQMEFNVDSSIAAFASLNVSDFNVKAGTAPSGTSTVTAEVIDCWGQPLGGKKVTFSVENGDGVVSPASNTTTSGNGVATSTYIVGAVAGPVLIKAVIED